MNWKIIIALLWKEWRETRWKWAVLLFSLHIPLLFFWRPQQSDWISVRAFNYIIFREILDAHFLGQAGFILTGGLFLTAFFSANISAPELESRRMFLLFERPVRRSYLLCLKFCVGGFETVIALGLSLLITISLAYAAVLLLSGDVTWGLSWRFYLYLLGGGLRATVITGCAGVAVYSLTFFLSILIEKWWVTVAASWITLALFFKVSGYRLLEWILRFVEVEDKIGHWKDMSLEQRKVASVVWAMEQPNLLMRPLPLITLLALSLGFFFATLYLFNRKELK